MTRITSRPPTTSGIGSEPLDSTDCHLAVNSRCPFGVLILVGLKHVTSYSSVHVVARFGIAIGTTSRCRTESRKAKEAFSLERPHGTAGPGAQQGPSCRSWKDRSICGLIDNPESLSPSLPV